MAKHARPHFNTSGGCICTCRRCLRVTMRENDSGIHIRQSCCCKNCNENCPSDRIVFITVPRFSAGGF